MRIFLIKQEDLSRFAGLYEDWLPESLGGDTLVLGAVDDAAEPPCAAGLLQARVTDTELLIEWLYVAPDCRRKGVASALLDRLLDAASREGTLTGIVAVLSQAQDELLAFFDDFGFGMVFREGCGEFRAQLGDLSPVPQRAVADLRVMPFHALGAGALRAFNAALVQGKAAHCGVPLPLRAEQFDPQSTVCCQGDTVCCLLLVRVRDGRVEVPWLYATPGRESALPLVFNCTLEALQQALPADTPLVFGTLARPGEALAMHLLPDAEWTEIYTAYWQL